MRDPSYQCGKNKLNSLRTESVIATGQIKNRNNEKLLATFIIMFLSFVALSAFVFAVSVVKLRKEKKK